MRSYCKPTSVDTGSPSGIGMFNVIFSGVASLLVRHGYLGIE